MSIELYMKDSSMIGKQMVSKFEQLLQQFMEEYDDRFDKLRL
ncbi:MAG: hypothetical protein K0R34_3371 [Herbinix sp.]|jgi:hypothetical protein|nr:hypothetical protein [Herbinix sp.]